MAEKPVKSPDATAKQRRPARVRVTWAGGHRFDASRADSTTVIRLDGSGETGPSPVDGLLSSLAACSAVDVVDILAKRRTPADELRVEVTGDRVNAVPARLERVQLDFHVGGATVERTHAERAIDLALTKYCSVRDSIAPDVTIEWTLTLNGETGLIINPAPARGTSK